MISKDFMDKDIAIALKSLKKRGIRGIYAKNKEEAKSQILDIIPQQSVVGIGDSTTVRQIGVIDALKKRGTKVLDGFYRGISLEEHYEMVRQSTLCDVFLTSSNALTLDGRIVSVDAIGNRIAGMVYGHRISIIVVGRNKLVKDLDEAFYRIRKLIAPTHIKTRIDLGSPALKTSCSITGECDDCISENRMCNVFIIIEGKPLRTDIYVVIVAEDLGLAWNERWHKQRISKIIDAYKNYVWLPPPPRLTKHHASIQ